MSVTRESSRWRFLITPRWLAWHVFVILSVLVILSLGRWQLYRAESGNSLSWAYTFEWPLFAIFAVYFWVKTIRDEVYPSGQAKPRDALALPGGAAEPAEDDEELAPCNAYLAHLAKEVSGHGRWHGLR
jgi:DNA-binding transcriptional regulator of glucitol operon